MHFPDLIDPASLGIHFFFEEVSLELPEEQLVNWIQTVLQIEQKRLQSIRFIFCQDDFLHQINVAYLNHDTLTDVITFPYSEEQAAIDGEIYISIDRVKENATIYQVPMMQELYRIIVHGILHLCGYEDKDENSKKRMKEKEDFYLKRLAL